MTSTSSAPRPSLVLRLRDRIRAEQDPDAGFAMLFTLLLIFIVAALSIAVAGIVYNQVQPTQQQRKTTVTVDAAYAGLQVALGQIRSAASGTTGVLPSLRCTGNTATTGATFATSTAVGTPTYGATFTGTVNTTAGNAASAGNSAYAVSVAYYPSDPTGQSLAWLASNAMSCPLSSVPAYAYLQSHGIINGQSSTSGDRTEHATYQFSTTNTNVAGGRLIILGGTLGLCVTDANVTSTSTTPKVNDPLTMQPCKAIGTANQAWSYRNDLTLYLAGFPTQNLCMQAASATAGASVSLQTCTGSGSGSTYPYASSTQQLQEWPFNDSGHFATASTLGSTNGTCLDPSGETSSYEAPQNTALVVVTCDGNTGGLQNWNPDPQVGAGKAGGNTTGQPGSPTNQYVNYAEFGRCLDITGQNVAADHLIDYPCKQTPDSTQLTFNQVWTYTASGTTGYGTMSVTNGGVKYCLTAPTTGNMITTSSTNCATTPSSATLWQTTGQVAGNYRGSYELVSKLSGLCMAADNAYNSQISDSTPGSSTIVAETCDGSLKQKWNAPPTNPNVGLGNINEDGGSANSTTP